MSYKLSIELVPQTCWFSNVRDNTTEDEWGVLKRATYRKANYKCEICGGKGEQHPVECHEIWDYDDKNKVQTLKGLIALCPSCHQVKHIGLAQKMGKFSIALNHFQKVNNTSRQESSDYIQKVFKIWEQRSNYQWTLDVSWLKDNFNMDIKPNRK